jgi:DNA topoisomerase-3
VIERMRGPVSADSLEDLLHRYFGFAGFRPAQEEVCRAALSGEDVLLVMPTGAGKSLCYQLPGLARGGTTLVVSPLIALMDDQVAKLRQMGFKAERIHSGLDRAVSRQVCLEYIAGNLDFLFIAPERFRIAGFPEMLEKHKPSLIAIDEAHCISQWGHDFRPDYRMIGQHLNAFRPVPVIAMTATATPVVQDDIHRQLGLGGRRFIQGFRRDNIAIEVVEVAPSLRSGMVRELLDDSSRRPAIVYAPSRKEVEQLAADLKRDFPAAAYHAGLDGERRSGVQSRFLSGDLEVIVATIAFGMGIDKPDIRTVIHTALPGSIEAYYQEIGRSGRDGKHARAILMHSYVDRRTHDYFFERDYPESTVLQRIYSRLGGEPQPKDAVAVLSGLDTDVFDAALEKLWIHGGAVIDHAENIMRGEPAWRPAYEAQRTQKLSHLDQILRFAGTNQCRMTSLVRHFGDLRDAKAACAICDFCAPGDCVAQRFRPPTAAEQTAAGAIAAILSKQGATATGKLFASAATGERNDFERVLGGMARAGLIELAESSWEKDGKTIEFTRANLTPQGRAAALTGGFQFQVAGAFGAEGKGKKRSRVKTKTARKDKSRPAGEESRAAAERAVKALRAWRLAEAKRASVPAFRVMSDKVLTAIAECLPQTTNELLAISGMGVKMVEKYGSSIFRIVSQARG